MDKVFVHKNYRKHLLKEDKKSSGTKPSFNATALNGG